MSSDKMAVVWETDVPNKPKEFRMSKAQYVAFLGGLAVGGFILGRMTKKAKK